MSRMPAGGHWTDAGSRADVGSLRVPASGCRCGRSRSLFQNACCSASTECTASARMPRPSATSPATRSSRAATSGSTVLGDRRVLGERARPRAHATDDPVLRRRSYGAWVAGGAPSGVPDGPTLTPGGFHSFEHRWALPEAFALHQGIGRERVEARIRGLASRLKARPADCAACVADAAVARCRPGSSASRSPAATPPRSSRASRRAASSPASRRTRCATYGSGRGCEHAEHVDAAAR